jgi:hypothetical protein
MNMKGQLSDFDLIVSSYGKHPMDLKRQVEAEPDRPTQPVMPGTLNESASGGNGHAPYRQFYPERMGMGE